jgi:lactate permease
MQHAAIYFIFASIPLVWLFIGLIWIRMPAHKAAVIGVLLTLFNALAVWRMPASHAFQALVEGGLFALWPIFWVILVAIFMYNMSIESGSMDTIKNLLISITEDKRVQALLLAMGFGGFIEAMAGYGTAVAIPASIMAAIGFEPMSAAIICLVANTVPTIFGVVGIPVITLAQITGLDLKTVTINVALQLLPFVVVMPFVLALLVTKSIRGLKGITGLCLASGAAFAIGQTVVAYLVGPELAAAAGSILSMAIIILWSKLKDRSKNNGTAITVKEGFTACLPFIIMIILIVSTRLLPFLDFLNKYPFVHKVYIYRGEGGKPVSFSLLNTPGSLLLLSTIVGSLFQGIGIKNIVRVFLSTARKLKNSMVTIVAVVALAKLMGYSGMVSVIAAGISAAAGGLFPVFSPLIGAIGTFLTGSDTSSNILFGLLQKQTAVQIGVSPDWLVAANGSGATAGKMISPQSIVIATTSTHLEGKEGEILSTTIKYCLAYVIILGAVIYFFST